MAGPEPGQAAPDPTPRPDAADRYGFGGAGEFGSRNQLHSPGEGEGPVVDLYQDRHVVRAVNGTWVIQARSRCPRHGKEGTTMPPKVTAIADLTAIGCRVETTATVAEKVRWLDRDPVIAGSRFTRPGGCGEGR